MNKINTLDVILVMWQKSDDRAILVIQKLTFFCASAGSESLLCTTTALSSCDKPTSPLFPAVL